MAPYNAMHSWLVSDEGATAIEYALMAAAIALAIVPVVTQLGSSIQAMLYDPIANAF